MISVDVGGPETDEGEEAEEKGGPRERWVGMMTGTYGSDDLGRSQEVH